MALEAENIESRPVWKPMHMQPVFQTTVQSRNSKAESKTKKTYKARVVGGEVAEDLFSRGICLPSGTAMTEEDLDRVISTILKCRK
jgi:dTDP-4-amino-4,6-dideoxygalactose transaminase